jgi:hypothetical protein
VALGTSGDVVWVELLGVWCGVVWCCGCTCVISHILFPSFTKCTVPDFTRYAELKLSPSCPIICPSSNENSFAFVSKRLQSASVRWYRLLFVSNSRFLRNKSCTLSSAGGAFGISVLMWKGANVSADAILSDTNKYKF